VVSGGLRRQGTPSSSCDDMMSLTFTATIFNIDFTGRQTADMNDNLVAAHIHASPTVTPTTNGRRREVLVRPSTTTTRTTE
jgi:hypothetical protein